jgi:hypothetical protein
VVQDRLNAGVWELLAAELAEAQGIARAAGEDRLSLVEIGNEDIVGGYAHLLHPIQRKTFPETLDVSAEQIGR